MFFSKTEVVISKPTSSQSEVVISKPTSTSFQKSFQNILLIEKGFYHENPNEGFKAAYNR